MQKIVIIVIISVLVLLNVLQFSWDYLFNRLRFDVVQNKEMAFAIANVVMEGSFESELTEVHYLPNRKAWLVYHPGPKDYFGGGAAVIVRVRDGKILKAQIYEGIGIE
jgi:hypothetical protein